MTRSEYAKLADLCATSTDFAEVNALHGQIGDEIQAKREELARVLSTLGEHRSALAVGPVVESSPAKPLREGVARLLGKFSPPPAPEPQPATMTQAAKVVSEMQARAGTLAAELKDLNEALTLIVEREKLTRRSASVEVCNKLQGAHRERGQRLLDAALALAHASADYQALIGGMLDAGVEIQSLRPFVSMMGADPARPGSDLAMLLVEAAERRLVRTADLPSDLAAMVPATASAA